MSVRYSEQQWQRVYANLYVISGGVNSGKTTALFRHFIPSLSADGVLQPEINGKRCLYLIGDKRLIELETEEESAAPCLRTGNYIFHEDAFEAACNYLTSKIPLTVRYFLIDGIGFLEMSDTGLHRAISKVIDSVAHSETGTKLIFTVRGGLLTDFSKKYLNGYIIKPLNIEQLPDIM
ncbi:MAG: nucleoside-triphosphatase [Ignavibacteria bacterium]|nr:nucleoside-triphosphatase [Ignavibacteria bacterium]